MVVSAGISLVSLQANAGSVFLSGHDSDFHAALGSNSAGAQNIINRALDFARDGNTAPILLLQSGLANVALGDHTDSEQGLIASGYAEGNAAGAFYVQVDTAQFLTTDLSLYSALFVPSDHGGSLTGDELQALFARRADILSYVNAGGGLVAFAEDGIRTAATIGPEAPNFGFAPLVNGSIISSPGSATETGYTLTAFGTTLGLTLDDINGNFSHKTFISLGGYEVVSLDASGAPVSIAFRGTFVPLPAAIWMFAAAIVALGARRRLRA